MMCVFRNILRRLLTKQTLYDRIKAAGITDEDTVKKMAMLANAVVLTSDGVGFMLSGEEMLRTKNGNDNSYNSSYE